MRNQYRSLVWLYSPVESILPRVLLCDFFVDRKSAKLVLTKKALETGVDAIPKTRIGHPHGTLRAPLSSFVVLEGSTQRVGAATSYEGYGDPSVRRWLAAVRWPRVLEASTGLVLGLIIFVVVVVPILVVLFLLVLSHEAPRGLH
jgi:hypothetical protein